MVNCKFTNHVNGVYAKSDNHFGNHLVFNGRVIEGYDQSVVQSVTDWLIAQESIAIDNFNYLIENGDEDAFTWLYILMLRTQVAELQTNQQNSEVVAEPMVELTISLYGDMLYIRDPEQTTTAEIDKDTKHSRVFELLQQLSKINRFKIPANRIDFVRHYPLSYSTIQLLLDCYEKANERKGLVEDKPVIETLSLLHFIMQGNNLIIREQIDNDWAKARNISTNSSNRAVAQWCSDNSPLYLKNTDAINLMSYREWSDDYCLSYLADVKKDYKKPMPKQNDEYAIVEPVSTYRMTFYYDGVKRNFERNEPCYFVRYNTEAESFDAIIGKPHNAVALPTNGDKYVMLAPCTVEEIKPLWTVTRPDDYQLEYKNVYVMEFESDSSYVNLVNWFLETQPILTDEQWQIIDDSADILNTLKLFKTMYK